MRQNHLEAKPEMSAALEKIATYRKTLPAKDFAKLLYAFDKKASLDRHYRTHLADPFKATFDRRITKEAGGYAFDDKNDSDLNCTQKELDAAFDSKYDKIKGYFGPTVAEQLKKHGCSIFDSLPVDAKSTIAKITKGIL